METKTNTHTEPKAHSSAPHSKATHKKTAHAKSGAHSPDHSGTSKKAPKKGKNKTRNKIIIFSVVGFLLLAGGAYFFYERYTYESTDDAMVQAHTTLLAPKVSGIVTQVMVEEHDRVKAGQILVRLEQKDYLADFSSARANLESAEVQLNNAKRDFERAELLFKQHAITHQNYDHANANYQDLERKQQAAQAATQQAELNLEYTEIRAPTDGFISRKSVEVGMNAAAGSALMGFVQTDERWVTANFKETQLDSVKVGKRVKVSVDAIPGREYEGIVESLSPSSGATFTLFPPDNATGNFTKVVQRVPVRIYLKNLNEDDIEKLQAGLSAEVEVIKHSDVEKVPEKRDQLYRAQLAQSLPSTSPSSLAQAPVQLEQKRDPNQTPPVPLLAPVAPPARAAEPQPQSSSVVSPPLGN